VLKRPGAPPRGSLWCTLWPGDGPPRATKVTVDAPPTSPEPEPEPGPEPEPEPRPEPGPELIRIGSSALTAERATGEIDTASWELEITANPAPAFPYLPSRWMYRTPLPRTKAVSLHPLAIFHGRIDAAGATLEIDGWPGMLGHNWGSEHAERWIWLHGAGFPGSPGAWLDVTMARIRLGRRVLPWIAAGAIQLDDQLHRLGGLAAMRSTSVDADPTGCRFELTGHGIKVRGDARVPDGQAVAWPYSDPRGGEHTAVNCSVARLTLSVSRRGEPERSLEIPAGAAYELGAREPPAGITIQPFTDP
jgi:hypothetical protein